jgi:hypothetical protein
LPHPLPDILKQREIALVRPKEDHAWSTGAPTSA